MGLSYPPEPSDSRMVAALYESAASMALLGRDLDIPVDRLWEAKRKPEYRFRTPYYRRRVRDAYEAAVGIGRFSSVVEKHLSDLRSDYDLANKASESRDSTPLQTRIIETWPLVNLSAGDFSRATDPAGLAFLSGTICLVATLSQLAHELGEKNALKRAAQDFSMSASRVHNTHLRFRCIISLASARQKSASLVVKTQIPIRDILDEEERRTLLELQMERLTLPTATMVDARNAVKLASSLEDRTLCAQARAKLLALDPAFQDPEHDQWSPGCAASDDPDLTFYRRFFC